MNKVAYIVYRDPTLYKMAEDNNNKDSGKKNTSSGPSDKKVYTQSEFDALLANYASGRTGGAPIGSDAIYENELKKRKTSMNILDSRVHNSALRAKGVNPGLVFGGALLGYGAGALTSKLLGFEEDGAWWDEAHRNQMFGTPGVPDSGSGFKIPTSVSDIVRMGLGNKPTAANDPKFTRALGRHWGTMNQSVKDSIFDKAKKHGYPQKVEDIQDSMGNSAFKVTYGDGSTGIITEGVGGAKQDFKEKGKNPLRWAGYGLRGLGFLLGGAIPYMTSRVGLELPYDASAYVYNRYIKK